MESINEVLQERGNEYGDFTNHAFMTQSLKRILRHGDGTKNMRAFQMEAMDMILHKIARIANGNPDNQDSWRDIEGYAKLVADRLRPKKTGPN